MAIPRAKSSASHIEGLPRLRAPYEKSRGGCVNCKQRRVKCDEVHPVCRNCRKGRRACSYAPRAQAPAFRGFRHVAFEPNQLPCNAITVSSEVRRSAEYFCLESLPILRKCQPSRLWDYLVAQLLDSQGTVRSIAAALGAQQRILEHQSGADNQLNDTFQQGSRLYANAITSLRQSINDASNVGPQIPLACLLMVMLESMRGCSANLLVHLQSGLTIMRSQQSSTTSESREVVRLLRRYAVDATLFDALSPSAQAVRLLLPEYTESGVGPNPLAQVVQLVSDLLRSLMQAAGAGMYDAHLAIPFNHSAHLRQQQQNVEKAISDRLITKEHLDAYSMAAYSLAKAQCLMAKIYIDYAWTGWQSDYDDALELFRAIVDLEDRSIRLMNSLLGEEERPVTPAAFSVGIPAQATLMLVIQQCRDVALRRRALDLLDHCPRFDGVRDTALVKAICCAIIRYEETAAGRPGQFIPEHCRVHHYQLLDTGQEAGYWHTVRLYCRHPESGEFVVQDVPLDVKVDLMHHRTSK